MDSEIKQLRADVEAFKAEMMRENRTTTHKAETAQENINIVVEMLLSLGLISEDDFPAEETEH